jgi:hypothetical protein
LAFLIVHRSGNYNPARTGDCSCLRLHFPVVGVTGKDVPKGGEDPAGLSYLGFFLLPVFGVDGFSQTIVRYVVVTTPFAERFPATPGAASRTNRSSTVSALSNSTIATGRAYVAVACYVFDLTKLAHFAV